MSAHIWRPRDPRAPADPPTTRNPAAPARPWPARSATPPSDASPSRTQSSSSPPPALSPEPVASPDADAVFRNLLNLHMDDDPDSVSSNLSASHRPSVHAAPFNPAAATTATPVGAASAAPAAARTAPSISAPLLPDMQAGVVHTQASTATQYLQSDAPISSSVLMSLPPLQVHPAYHEASMSAPRSAPVLRQPGPQVAGPVTANPMHQNGASAPRIKNELYKTEICRSYAETGGYCKYGTKCQFAHGEEELRPVRRHPRYKTKLCRNFVTTGSCPYDARCRFIHANDLPYSRQNGSVTSSSVGPVTAASSSMAFAAPPPTHLSHAQQQQLFSTDHHPALGRDKYSHSDNGLQHYLGALPSSTSAASGVTDRRLNSLVESLNGEQRAASSLLEYQTDKAHLHSVLPTDEVFYPDANGFQNYPDNNAFHHTFMHLFGVDGEYRTHSADLSDRDPVHTSLASSTLAGVVGPELDVSVTTRYSPSPADTQSKSLFSHPPPPSTPSLSGSIPTPNGTVDITSSSEVARETVARVAPSSSPVVSRSRLPVFLNMARDPNEL